MKLFNYDSPLMQTLSKMADLMWLNILTLICCIPFFTIGASLTALNYMTLKIVRDEECYVTRGFFKSFKENIKQATIIWLLLFLVTVVLVSDLIIMANYDVVFGSVVRVVVSVMLVFVVFTAMYVFPVLAKFESTIKQTVRNAFLMSITQFPKTILMVIIYLVPLVLLVLVYQTMPLCFLFGLSVPAWLSAKLYNNFFKRLEAQIVEASGKEKEDNGDEHIFSDEVIENLSDSTSSK